MNLVEQGFRDNRLMRALIYIAIVAEVPIIKWVREHFGYVSANEGVAVACDYTSFREEGSDPVKRGRACGVKFEGLLNDRGSLAVDDDLFRAVVVEVANGSLARELASTNLFAKPPLGILRKGIHVIFALPEHDVEHEFALRVGFKTECRKSQGFELSSVQKIYDLAAVDTVSSQTVRMPCENAFRFASADACEHIIEKGPARGLCRPFLNEFGDKGEVLAFGELPQLIQLSLD